MSRLTHVDIPKIPLQVALIWIDYESFSQHFLDLLRSDARVVEQLERALAADELWNFGLIRDVFQKRFLPRPALDGNLLLRLFIEPGLRQRPNPLEN